MYVEKVQLTSAKTRLKLTGNCLLFRLSELESRTLQKVACSKTQLWWKNLLIWVQHSRHMHKSCSSYIFCLILMKSIKEIVFKKTIDWTNFLRLSKWFIVETFVLIFQTFFYRYAPLQSRLRTYEENQSKQSWRVKSFIDMTTEKCQL